ncbi:hypothetical protein RI054_43g152290 [Pseudoscourfieldia marina]
MPYASEAKSWSDSCRLYKERVRSRRLPDDALVPERYVRNRRETMTHRTPLNLPPENDKAELYRQHTRLDYDKWTRNGWGICELTATAPCPIRGRHASPEKARFTKESDKRTSSRTGLKLVPGIGPGVGKNRPPVQNHSGTRRRENLFGTLQHTETLPNHEAERSEPDAWVGNVHCDPTEGKRPGSGMHAHGNRQRMYDVLGYTAKPPLPRMEAHSVSQEEYDTRSDSWLGNKLVDPAKGKMGLAPPLDLDVRRTNGLFDVLCQKKLPLAPQMKRAGIAGFDSWCGHTLIDPLKGKGHGVHDSVGTAKKMLETMRHGCGGYDDRGRHEDSWIGTNGFDPNRGRGRGSLHPPAPEHPRAHLGEGALYAHDTENPPAPPPPRFGRRNNPPGPSANTLDMFTVTHGRGTIPSMQETIDEFGPTKKLLPTPGQSVDAHQMLKWAPVNVPLKIRPGF